LIIYIFHPHKLESRRATLSSPAAARASTASLSSKTAADRVWRMPPRTAQAVNTKKKPGPVRTKRSALAQTADALRRLAMSREDGAFLGSEEQLIRLLGASRPTLRQASAQLVQENLIEIRRGGNGGYFARTPQSSVVSRMAAIYLLSHDVALEEIVQSIEPVRVEIAKLAAHSPNRAARARLGAFLTHDTAMDAEAGYRGFLRSEREFGRILGELSGSRVMMLFLHILYDFAAMLRRGEGVFAERPDRVGAYREIRSQLGRAIYEGNEEAAIAATRRSASLVNGWLHEDHDNTPRDMGQAFELPVSESIGSATL
jgi:GntR family transcriptional regulator, transcriptional repressor for pyruvate dehydrogenase complex